MKSHATSRKNLLRRQLGLVVILFAGFAASLGLYHFFNYTEARRTGDEFLRRASVRHALINESIRGYEECLHNLKNLFTNSEDVSPAEFTATALDIRTRHRGIQALQWVPVIPGDLRAETEAWARREIAPSYTFTERGPDGSLVPAADGEGVAVGGERGQLRGIAQRRRVGRRGGATAVEKRIGVGRAG